MSKPSIAAIKRHVASHSGVSLCDIDSLRRDAGAVQARHLAMFLARKTGAPLAKIGRAFGDRDHTTVLNAIRKVTAKMAHDQAFHASVAALQHAVEGLVG